DGAGPQGSPGVVCSQRAGRPRTLWLRTGQIPRGHPRPRHDGRNAVSAHVALARAGPGQHSPRGVHGRPGPEVLRVDEGRPEGGGDDETLSAGPDPKRGHTAEERIDGMIEWTPSAKAELGRYFNRVRPGLAPSGSDV